MHAALLLCCHVLCWCMYCNSSNKHDLFFFPVTNTFKRTNDFVTSKAPASDLNHKFRCTVVDYLKFFRKAKLLHYHMKYFHGIGKVARARGEPRKEARPDQGLFSFQTRPARRAWPGSGSQPVPKCTFWFCNVSVSWRADPKAGVRLVWSSWILPDWKWQVFRNCFMEIIALLEETETSIPYSTSFLAAWVTLRKSHLRV